MTAQRLFSSDLPPSPKSLVVHTKKSIPSPLNNIPHLPFLLATSSKSLVDRRRFQQNGPVSQHVRKEPAKNKILVKYGFELTAWRLFSSDLPPPPKSLVNTRKALPVTPQKNPVPQKNSPLSIPLVLPPSSKSLVDNGRFRQNGPASQHVRNEPTKNQLLGDFCFELTA